MKHLQGCSTGLASTFCLAISLSVEGDKTNRLGEHLVALQLLLPVCVYEREKEEEEAERGAEEEGRKRFRAHQQQ